MRLHDESFLARLDRRGFRAGEQCSTEVSQRGVLVLVGRGNLRRLTNRTSLEQAIEFLAQPGRFRRLRRRQGGLPILEVYGFFAAVADVSVPDTCQRELAWASKSEPPRQRLGIDRLIGYARLISAKRILTSFEASNALRRLKNPSERGYGEMDDYGRDHPWAEDADMGAR